MGKKILLQGITTSPPSCRAIGGHKLKGLLRRKAVTHMVQLRQVPHDFPLHAVTSVEHQWHQCPPSVQNVLLQYSAVF